MDTGTHLRAVWQRRWLVLGAALAVAAVVFGIRSAQEAVWTTEAQLYLVVGDQDRPEAVERLTVLYGETLEQPEVVADTITRAGLTVDAADLRRRVAVESPSEGRLDVTANGSTPEQSVRLANAAADALSAGAAREQAARALEEAAPLAQEVADLSAQVAALPVEDPSRVLLEGRLQRADAARLGVLGEERVRLDVVRRPEAASAERAPRPARDAALALVLALILGAEASALLAARRRGLEGADPVPQLERWTGLPAFRVGPGRHGPDEAPAAVRFLRADARTAAVPRPALAHPGSAAGVHRVVGELAEGGARVTWFDLAAEPAVTSGLPKGVDVRRRDGRPLALATEGADRRVVVSTAAWEDRGLMQAVDQVTATSPWWSTRTAREPDVAEALRVLAYADLSPAAVLVVEGPGAACRPRSRRRPRRARPPLPPLRRRRPQRRGPPAGDPARRGRPRAVHRVRRLRGGGGAAAADVAAGRPAPPSPTRQARPPASTVPVRTSRLQPLYRGRRAATPTSCRCCPGRCAASTCRPTTWS